MRTGVEDREEAAHVEQTYDVSGRVWEGAHTGSSSFASGSGMRPLPSGLAQRR